MFLETNTPVKEIMTSTVHFVRPETIMSAVGQIFSTQNFHHIPVLDDDGKVLGIISKSDYYQLQNHFTRLKMGDCDEKNNRFFQSLTADDVMTKNPVCIGHDTSIASVMQIFLENLFHAIPVLKDNVCIGIVTPHDILAFVNNKTLSLSS